MGMAQIPRHCEDLQPAALPNAGASAFRIKSEVVTAEKAVVTAEVETTENGIIEDAEKIRSLNLNVTSIVNTNN